MGLGRVTPSPRWPPLDPPRRSRPRRREPGRPGGPRRPGGAGGAGRARWTHRSHRTSQALRACGPSYPWWPRHAGRARGPCRPVTPGRRWLRSVLSPRVGPSLLLSPWPLRRPSPPLDRFRRPGPTDSRTSGLMSGGWLRLGLLWQRDITATIEADDIGLRVGGTAIPWALEE